MRVIVAGWRAATAEDHGEAVRDGLYRHVRHHFGSLWRPADDITLVHGQCHLGGVDLIADRLATGLGWQTERHPAQGHPTQDFGVWPACGPLRNAYMVGLGADLFIGYPGPRCKGTWNAMRQAVDAGIPTECVTLLAPGPVRRRPIHTT